MGEPATNVVLGIFQLALGPQFVWLIMVVPSLELYALFVVLCSFYLKSLKIGYGRWVIDFAFAVEHSPRRFGGCGSSCE